MISGLTPRALAQIGEAVGYAMGGGGGGGPAQIVYAIDLSRVEASLDHLCRQGSELLSVVANPDATAAVEKLNKASIAMSRGWHDDAEHELRASIDLFRYRARPHFMLGVSRLFQGDAASAVVHLQDAVKYGAEQDQDAAISAGLLATTLLIAAGQQSPVVPILESLNEYGACLEVLTLLHMAGQDHSHEIAALLEASVLEPGIAQVATSAIAPEAGARIGDLDEVRDSWVSYMRQAEQIARSVDVRLETPLQHIAVQTEGVALAYALRDTSEALHTVTQFEFVATPAQSALIADHLRAARAAQNRAATFRSRVDSLGDTFRSLARTQQQVCDEAEPAASQATQVPRTGRFGRRQRSAREVTPSRRPSDLGAMLRDAETLHQAHAQLTSEMAQIPLPQPVTTTPLTRRRVRPLGGVGWIGSAALGATDEVGAHTTLDLRATGYRCRETHPASQQAPDGRCWACFPNS